MTVSFERKKKYPAFWLLPHKNWSLCERKSTERKLTMGDDAHKEETRDAQQRHEKIMEDNNSNKIAKKERRRTFDVISLKNDTCQ